MIPSYLTWKCKGVRFISDLDFIYIVKTKCYRRFIGKGNIVF